MTWLLRLTDVTHKWRGPTAWAFAVALTLASIAMRFALGPWMPQAAFPTFYPAILIAALACGWRVGLLVLILSTMAARYFFIEPQYLVTVADGHTAVRVITFLMLGGMDVWLVATLGDLVTRLNRATRMQDSLFKELQHRVANNMQVVAATLQTARSEIRDPAMGEIVDLATSRIVAMGKLHRRLYDSAAYAEGLEPILRDVLDETFDKLPVRVIVAIEPRNLSLDQMIAILLLTNEAAINAAKHVFRSEQGTLFEVTLSMRKAGQLTLLIRDDGPGLGPVRQAGPRTQRLGMTIMKAFADQLGGPLRILDGQGTTLSVDFPA